MVDAGGRQLVAANSRRPMSLTGASSSAAWLTALAAANLSFGLLAIRPNGCVVSLGIGPFVLAVLTCTDQPDCQNHLLY